MDKKKKITQEIRNALRADFPDEAYKQHPTKTFLTTLKAMYVTERLNDVFGIGRWSIIFEIIERTDDYVLGQGEFISLDFDVIVPKQFGGHKTSGTNVEIADGYKSALTDCQSKIASYFEIGIDMFKGKITKGSGTSDTKKESTTQPTEWLNKWNKDKTKILSFYLKVVNGAKEQGKTVKDLRSYYKISTEIAKELEIDLKS